MTINFDGVHVLLHRSVAHSTHPSRKLKIDDSTIACGWTDTHRITLDRMGSLISDNPSECGGEAVLAVSLSLSLRVQSLL